MNVRGLDLTIDPSTPLVLSDQAEEALTVEADGSYSFAAELESGASYAVSVAQQPNEPRQFCFIERQQAVSGEITGDVTLNVDCGLAYHGLFPGWGVGAAPDSGSLRPLQIAPATLVALRVDGQDEVAVVDPCQVETRGAVSHDNGTHALEVTTATACEETLFLTTTMTPDAFTVSVPDGIDELPDELRLDGFAATDQDLPTAALGHAVADAEAADLQQHHRWLISGVAARQADAISDEDLHGDWGLVALTMALDGEDEPQWVRHGSVSVPAVITTDGSGDLRLNADGWRTLTAATQVIGDDPPPPPITQGFTQEAPGAEGFDDVPLTLSAEGRLQAGESHGFVSADGDFFLLVHSEPTPEQVRAGEDNDLGEGQGAHQVLMGVRRDENLVSLDGRTYALFGPSYFLSTVEESDPPEGLDEFELAPLLDGSELSFSAGEASLAVEEETWIAPFGGNALDIQGDSETAGPWAYAIGNDPEKPQLVEIDLGDGFGPERDNYLTGYAHGNLLVLSLGARADTLEPDPALGLGAEISLLGLISLSVGATVNGDDGVPAEAASVGTFIGICVQGCADE